MAVLSKIRQRSLLLILVIGFCLLAFIVGDIINSGGFTQTSRDVGSINGKDISFEEYRVKVANVEKSAQGVSPIQAANRVWDQEIAIALLTTEFDKLGIRVGENHIIEVFKQDQQIGQNPMFKNAAGEFDIAKFKEFFKSSPEQAKYLNDRQADAELNAKFQVYNSLVKGGLYTTATEGKLKYELEANKVTFEYVAVPYSSVKDSEVKVTDEEIVDYMRKHEKKYKAEESREVEYVLIADKPSKTDEDEVKNKVNALLSGTVVYNKETGKNDTLPGFKYTANTAEFVNANSDILYDSTYVAKKDLDPATADALFNLPEGEVFGPYMRGDFFCISKSMGRKAGANAKASHVLISWEGTQVNKREKRTKEEAKVKADQILAQAQANPQGFMMLALTNSDDSSAQQGGDLGYFSQGQMVKPFNDFVFNNPIGTIGLVESEFGYHVINVTDKQDAVRLATIAQKIEPSEATADQLYAQAVKFELDASEKDFAATAKTAGLTVNPSVKVKAMDENFGAVGNQRQIIRWAYEKGTKVGDVKRFEVANMGNVIAKMKKVNEKGLMAVDEARLSIEPILKNKKKAEKIKAKMTGTSLETIAKASAGVAVQLATDLTVDSPILPNVGGEGKVVATAFAIGANKMSAPIEGNMGVYVVKTKTVTKAPVIKDYAAYVNKLKQQRGADTNRVIPALKTDADIVDNRAVFN